MMVTRADIRNFLLALPLAVIVLLCTTINLKAGVTGLLGPESDAATKVQANDISTSMKYYADKPEVEIDPEIRLILEKFKDKEDVLTPMEKLASFTGQAGFNNFGETWLTDSKATDMLQRIRRRLNRLSRDGYITYEQNRKIFKYAQEGLYNIGAQRAKEATALTGNEDKIARIESANEFVSEGFDSCPTIDLIKAKYQAGCWSCLIVERLSSAFMTAASKAYSLSQKAGLILLGIGTALWLAFWGLRNVSSLTQLEPGNILNELIKFGFKVALAYTFIVLGLRMVSTYFITPIMGVGAKIAEAYWDKKFEPYLEDYSWETQVDIGGLSEEEQKKLKEQHAANVELANKERAAQSLDMAKLQLASMDEEERQKNLDAINNAARKVSISGVPQFVIYPTTGAISSEFGRREYSGCKMHAGLDISARVGTPVVAAFDGTIGRAGWENPNNRNQGYGMRLYIQHPGNWQTVYAHLSSIVVKSGDPVRKGNIIAYTGDTGRSGGPHLHFEIRTPENRPVDPVGIADGEVNAVDYVGTRNECDNPYGGKQNRGQVSPNITPIPLSGDYVYGSEADSSGSGTNYSSLVLSIPAINYTGPTDIMPKSVMNSILGATKAIGDITSENMVLGDAIMCYATLENGGAWHPFGYTFTNFWMWFEGAFIWCTGMLLTLAVAYYLLDISFKIGFAVVALPIVVGLWPFDITKDKFSVCVSIIAKSAAIFAFLAMTTTFTVQLTNAVYSYDDGDAAVETDPNAPKGLAKLYEVYDRATMADVGATKLTEAQQDADMAYASSKLAIFSTTFVLILFAFLYSFKLVKATVPELVNKFFPDKAFGDQQPMHHWATAASKWVKDQAMKPVGWARDAALYQGGRLAKNAVGKTVGGVAGSVRSLAGKGKGDAKTVGGMAARGVGNMTTGIGKAMSAVGLAKAGAAVQNAGQKVKDAGNSLDKSYNKFATRNKKDENGNAPDAQKKEGGKK